MVDFAKSRVDCALSPCRFINLLKLIIDPALMSNLAIVNQPRNIEKDNRKIPIGTKPKNGCDVVAMSPSVVKVSLILTITWLLEIQLDPIHHWPHIGQKWISCPDTLLVHCNVFICQDTNHGEGIIFQGLDNHPASEPQVRTEVTVTHPKNELKSSHWPSRTCPNKNKSKTILRAHYPWMASFECINL